MFDGRWRSGVDSITHPIGRVIAKAGISADALTAFGLLTSAASAVAIGAGWLIVGTVLLIATGLSDLLDGPVAQARNSSSVRGTFFDSTADRVTDALLLGGIAWYLASSQGAQWAVLPMAVLAISSIISYERAKAELLGFVAKGGLMERAERIIILAVAVAFEFLLIPLLFALGALSLITLVTRFAMVWAQATRAGTK